MRWLRQGVLFLALAARAALGGDLDGIWTGQVTGKLGAPDDIAFQFKVGPGGRITGKLFGDEIDLPVEDASLVGDKLKFTITTTNYYSGVKVKFVYSGTVTKDRMELGRERLWKPDEKHEPDDSTKHTFSLKKLVS